MKSLVKMKYITFVERVRTFLRTHYNKLTYVNKNVREYYSLAPVSNAEKSDVYLDALFWALSQGERVRNIALTGPYGSGKSSIILSFEKKYSHVEDWRFLKVSLATFKEEKTVEDDEVGKQETLRLIELSILQQIFYHVSDEKIPDSRFSKIKKLNRRLSKVLSLYALLGTTSFLYLLKPDLLKKFSLFEVTGVLEKVVFIIAVLVSGLTFIFIAYKMILFISSFVIKQISINNTVIEVNDEKNKSILNQHLDEIVYFFEETDYNVVIIEDLDRFEQTEVFTKLREINLLLNNSEKIDRNIVFLYAVRDEMFETKERAKFFDFIVPVVPVINFSNSKEKLLGIKKHNDYNFSNEVINDLSLFVDDMRLLYNVSNEYFLYREKITSNISQDKLLAMIVYKNAYPSDFSRLSRSEGDIYKILSLKEELIKRKISDIKVKINGEKIRLSKAEAEKVKYPMELKQIYLYRIIEKIFADNPSYVFGGFFINNKKVSLAESLKSEYFFKIKEELSAIQYFYHSSGTHHRTSVGFDFDEVENEGEGYEDRLSVINDSSQENIREIVKRIKRYETEIYDVQKMSLSVLISNIEESFDVIQCEESKKKLIKALIVQDYIGEDYLDYISIFYEGSLSRSDHDFLVSIKLGNRVDYNHHLEKIDNLLNQLPPYLLERSNSLSYLLLDFFLSNAGFSRHREVYFKLLTSEKDEVISFIVNYIKRSINLDLFYNHMCGEWSEIWAFLRDHSSFIDSEKKEVIRDILENAELHDLGIVFEDYLFEIEELTPEYYPRDRNRFVDVLHVLKPLISNVSDDYPEDVLVTIKKESYYKISIDNLKFFLKDLSDNDFYRNNLTAIRKSKDDNLYEYIKENIEEYCVNVFLEIDSNMENDEEDILYLLNSIDLSIEAKRKVIKKIVNPLIRIDEVDEDKVLDLVFRLGKVKPDWNLVIDAYVRLEDKLSIGIVKYLSDINVSKALSEFKIDSDYPDRDTRIGFEASVLKEDTIPEDSYVNILKSIKQKYTKLFFKGISVKKVQLLIDHKTLDANGHNYLYLIENYNELAVRFIEENESEVGSIFSELEYNEGEVLKLLRSNRISDSSKENVLLQFDYDNYSECHELHEIVLKILTKKRKSRLTDNIVQNVLLVEGTKVDVKLKAFLNNYQVLKREMVSEFLKSLPEPYSLISIFGKRPSVPKDELHLDFLNILKETGYISNYNKKIIGGKIQVITFKKGWKE